MILPFHNDVINQVSADYEGFNAYNLLKLVFFRRFQQIIEGLKLYKKGGAQIDLLIDRRDDVINLCEMKCTDKAYEITADYRENLINKVAAFTEEVKPKKSVHITLITSNGYKQNEYSDVVQNCVEPGSLFM